MEFSFDPQKDAANRRKHGISLARANEFDFNSAQFEVDDRKDYGELRWSAVGFLDARLYSLTFVEIDQTNLRVISLRKASNEERRRYDRVRG